MTPAEAVAALDTETSPQEYVPTGSLVLDLAMGGWPVGRLSEITGDPLSGKTTLLYVAAAEMQKLRQGPVLWADYRGEFSPRKAAQAGVDTANLLVTHGLPRFDLGPVRHVVADTVTSWRDAEDLLEVAGSGKTVVASSWKYRTFAGKFPWVDLKFASMNHVRASVTCPALHDVVSYRLQLCPQGIDQGQELMDLGEKAGLVIQRGSHWYFHAPGSPTEAYLGSGREKAGRELLILPEDRELIKSILTQS